MVKRLPTMQETWVWKWQPTPVFMPGKSHGPRSLVGYSSWGWKESDTTERLTSLHTKSWEKKRSQSQWAKGRIIQLNAEFQKIARREKKKWSESEVTQSCLTLCNPIGCSPPGSSVHGILQARVLEWVAIPFSRGSSWPRDWTQVSCIAGKFFTVWAIKEAQESNF